MNQATLIGAAIGGATVLSFGAVAGYQAVKGPSYAEVLNVQEVRQVVMTPEQSCADVQVTHRKPVQDQQRIAGTAIGAVLGGVLGHQMGGGNGKTLTTVVGAAAGGYAGNKVQQNMQNNDTTVQTERRCKTANVKHEEVVGYDVKYSLGGKIDTVRMNHRPDERIPVKDGQLVLADAATGSRTTATN
ncbi:MAG: glycine zipper 2TM domain-containing protein [Burkholderiales bacterium]|nr:glycine zipper 2TM domain-containing protein [Burkholderiales bacterium]